MQFYLFCCTLKSIDFYFLKIETTNRKTPRAIMWKASSLPLVELPNCIVILYFQSLTIAPPPTPRNEAYKQGTYWFEGDPQRPGAEQSKQSSLHFCCLLWLTLDLHNVIFWEKAMSLLYTVYLNNSGLNNS